jgi:hypothetical protein
MRLRLALPLFALAAIGVCCWGGWYDWHDHWLVVHNAGSAAALVSVEWDGHDEDALVDPGESVTFSFGWSGVDVTITRLWDGALLYREYLHPDDFDDHDGVIHVTVTP